MASVKSALKGGFYKRGPFRDSGCPTTITGLVNSGVKRRMVRTIEVAAQGGCFCKYVLTEFVLKHKCWDEAASGLKDSSTGRPHSDLEQKVASACDSRPSVTRAEWP